MRVHVCLVTVLFSSNPTFSGSPVSFFFLSFAYRAGGILRGFFCDQGCHRAGDGDGRPAAQPRHGRRCHFQLYPRHDGGDIRGGVARLSPCSLTA